jgi:hypothetical protein
MCLGRVPYFSVNPNLLTDVLQVRRHFSCQLGVCLGFVCELQCGRYVLGLGALLERIPYLGTNPNLLTDELQVRRQGDCFVEYLISEDQQGVPETLRGTCAAARLLA